MLECWVIYIKVVQYLGGHTAVSNFSGGQQGGQHFKMVGQRGQQFFLIKKKIDMLVNSNYRPSLFIISVNIFSILLYVLTFCLEFMIRLMSNSLGILPEPYLENKYKTH